MKSGPQAWGLTAPGRVVGWKQTPSSGLEMSEPLEPQGHFQLRVFVYSPVTAYNNSFKRGRNAEENRK